MKRTALLLALLTSLTPVRVQAAPPPEDGFFDTEIAPPAARDGGFRFAQARPEENRDRSSQRPPEPRPPGSPSGDRGPSPGGGGGKSENIYSVNARGFVTQRDGRSRTPPIIVSNQPLDPKVRAAAEEDLGIMARLLEKEIERDTGVNSPPDALGIPISTRFEGRSSTLLLEGYGAVFTFTVRMPLTPPPARATEKKADRPSDSPWERTRRELFGASGDGSGREGEGGGRGAAGMMGFGSGDGWMNRRDGADYDGKKVEALKQSLLEALKQAANIRALKADEHLTIVVQGGSGGGFGPMEFGVETRTTTSTGGGGGPPRTETLVNRSTSGDGPRSGTLIVRAKKSDAADFANGKLTAEQFAKKAQVTVR